METNEEAGMTGKPKTYHGGCHCGRVRFEVDGSIRGNAGCNSFSGSLEKTDAGVKVGPLGATRMACPDPAMSRETAFLGALQQATVFEVAGQRMTSLDSEGNLLVEFAALD